MSKTGNVFDSNDANHTPAEDRPRATLRLAALVVLALAFFLVGFYVIGPRLRPSGAAPPSNPVNLSREDWGQVPEPARPAAKKEAPTEARVQVSEIHPDRANLPAAKPDEPRDELSVTLSPNPTSAPTTEAPAKPPTPPPAPAPKSPPQEKGFCVQAGVFSNRNNAETVANTLANMGYGASVKQVTREGKLVYVTLVGNPKSKDEAERLASQLRDAGKNVIVAPVE